ncbi:hypothetical protein OX886_23460 [Serratia marcescens]|uniref:hypothetical protein n=1 Tax=Serratia marcescens TaxID=615 RepID=UPI003338906D
MIDKYLLEDLSLRSDEKGELARWVIQLQADVDTERRTSASLESVIYARDTRIAELEAKLATPVRLLGEMLPHEWERAERQAAFEHRKIAWDARLAEDKKAILAAGFTFTVEGDDQ